MPSYFIAVSWQDWASADSADVSRVLVRHLVPQGNCLLRWLVDFMGENRFLAFLKIAVEW